MSQIILDIETGPINREELMAFYEPLPDFDKNEVKHGNTKDPKLIADKIATERAKHEASKLAHEQDFIGQASLSAITGRILAIGLKRLNGDVSILGQDESDEALILKEFWDVIKGSNQKVGFNIHLFDLPFLVRRSYKHGVPIPPGVRAGRYWSNDFIDLREVWQLGDRQAKGSLDSIGRFFGLPPKEGNGGEFAELWATDKQKAIDYLKRDLNRTEAIARKMGVIKEMV